VSVHKKKKEMIAKWYIHRAHIAINSATPEKKKMNIKAFMGG